MKYKGIEYKVLETTTAGVWAWSIEPPKSIPIQGKAKSSSTASRAAMRAINEWLKSNVEERDASDL
jgi:hypothetical protein